MRKPNGRRDIPWLLHLPQPCVDLASDNRTSCGRAHLICGGESKDPPWISAKAAFSNYRVPFIKPDLAVADALLTVSNVNGPDGTILPVIPINFFFVAVRHDGQWLIEDGRAFLARAA